MFRSFLAALFMLCLAVPVAAQDDPIQGVISSQLEAFKRDDFSAAFTHASPFIKNMFGTAERFGMMVQRGYPMVWRPADVTYVEQETRGGVTYQTVRIRDNAGTFHFLEYEMIPAGDTWQINGVRFVAAPGFAA